MTSSASSGGGRAAHQAREPVVVEVRTPMKAEEINNYTRALEYLNQCANFEKLRPSRITPDAFRLDRMRAILEHLGDPQLNLRCVHIAGSKGKGSTAEMVASALAACGYATGIYTSPHLVDVRERIRINGQMIGYSQFARLMQQVGTAAEAVADEHGEATYFELLTALALCYFAEQAVDVAVVEVGLGGRLDSTNIIHPEVSAITAIQLEHTQILGDTLAKIAREKAGIFKPGVPAITVEQTPEVMAVLHEVAAEQNAPLDVVGKTINMTMRLVASPELGPHARLSIHLGDTGYDHIAVPLKGEHQALNCALALAILLKLRQRDFDLPEGLVARGLEQTPSCGRMELLRTRPQLLLDGAHTPDSIKALIKAIGTHIRYDSMVVIFGCAEDKDVDGMLRAIAQGADKIIFTKAKGTPRAAPPQRLAKRFTELSGKAAQVAPTVEEALKFARTAAHREDLICITGSIYIAGEARKILAAPPPSR